MNSLRDQNWMVGITMASIIALVPSGLAAGNEAAGRPVKSREVAEQLPLGSKVTLACATCKTVLDSQVDKKKSFLAWFEPKSHHECPGCGGIYGVYHREPLIRSLREDLYTHVFHLWRSCYSNAPGHKVK